LRSGPLAAWACAWIAGQVSPDEALDAVTGADAPHDVAGLGDDSASGSLLDLLVAWRREDSPVRLVLPVAGDVRGLPGPPQFRAAALQAGEAVCGGSVGVVPSVVDFAPSSAPARVVWQAFSIDAAPPDYVQLADAQFELATAIRDATATLAEVAAATEGWSSRSPAGVDVEALHDARRASERLNLPPQFPSRAIAVLAQTERLQAILDLARSADDAVDQAGITRRAEAFRPLSAAVRRARLAGYNALAT
jgi:hypothetical protein